MRFQCLASGSSGNCTYVGSDNTHLLVDAGVSRKRINDGLNSIGLDLKDLSGILITHEHSDHIAALSMIAKKYDVPFYATGGTIDAILTKNSILTKDRFIEVHPDEKMTVGDMEIDPMTISHDAADPVGYRLACGGKRACVCTDLGCYTDYTVNCLKEADVLLLEANHDVNMLQIGPYPYSLKQRILGDHGHLSNLSSGELLTKVLNDHMKGIFLGHLSDENNYPDLAYQTVRVEIAACQDETGFCVNDLPLAVAKRSEPSVMVEF